MKIAQQLRQTDMVAYLLYMWYVEDLLRANGCDAERVTALMAAGAKLEERDAMAEWYDNLAEMMRAEGVTQGGHLQMLRNLVMDLTELHIALTKSSKFPFYSAAYFKALPLIVELRQRNGQKLQPEIETCLEALYGIYLLRMQQKPVTPATLDAAKCITTFLGLLSDYYLKERRGELDRYHLDEEKPRGGSGSPSIEGESPRIEGENPRGETGSPCGETENPCGEAGSPCGETENPRCEEEKPSNAYGES